MVEVIGFFVSVGEIYKEFLLALPFWQQNFINLFLLVFLIVVYAVFIWKLYRFIARKDVFLFDVKRFHRENKSVYNRLVSATGYFIKNIVVFPLLIFFWYSIFTVFLMILTEDLPLSRILIISALIIASIRATAYYKEGLSKDLAKLLPLTLLAVFLTQSTVFNFGDVLANFSQIPSFLKEISMYYLFILILEAILRIIDIFFVTSGIEEPDETKSEEN